LHTLLRHFVVDFSTFCESGLCWARAVQAIKSRDPSKRTGTLSLHRSKKFRSQDVLLCTTQTNSRLEKIVVNSVVSPCLSGCGRPNPDTANKGEKKKKNLSGSFSIRARKHPPPALLAAKS